MATTPTTHHSFARAVWVLLLILPLATLPAVAQDPVVNSADPSSAEQETFDLDVLVSGDNFSKESVVEFLVTGTPNPGGIHVKKVKQQGPKTLKVTVDVDADAVVDDFDIQVMSRGRTGKGIELFRVMEKTHPTQDTTPPGQVTISVEGTSYNTVTLAWIAPADDGHDQTSGPAERYNLWCRLGDVPIDESVGWECGCEWSVWAGAPGSQELCLVESGVRDGLLPNSTYSFAVRTRDDADNFSVPSNRVVAATDPFVGDLSWTIQEVPAPMEFTLGHGFDLAGEPMIVGVFDDQFRIARGTWQSGSQEWLWTLEDVPGQIKGNQYTWDPYSFAMDPFGVPAFGASTSPKGHKLEVVYTFHDGSQWVHEVVESPRATYLSGVQLAFDPSGNPALAYTMRHSRSEEGQLRLARKDLSGTWSIEIVDPVSGLTRPTLAFDGTGNPVITYPFDETTNPPTEVVKVVIGSDEGWQTDTLSFANAHNLHFVWDPIRQQLVGAQEQHFYIWYCEGLSGSWDCNEAFYGDQPGPGFLTVDDNGRVFVAYRTFTDDINLASSPDGVTWTHELVDYAWIHFQDGSIDYSGPHLALDLSGSPTLSWMWNNEIDFVPVDRNTYFAWKVATP